MLLFQALLVALSSTALAAGRPGRHLLDTENPFDVYSGSTPSLPSKLDEPAPIIKVVAVGSLFSFDPANITINAGDTVNWQWYGFLPHSVTESKSESEQCVPLEGGFDSGWLWRSEYNHTFTKPGIHYYHCKPHCKLGMVGKVIVN
ncbi:Cupredoxin [Ramicandelaber brevisporus]|nr:Cupredoxin [Ramicandelaber brevisporus]